MDWYKIWQENHLFMVEKNMLKKKRYIYTPSVRVNQDGFKNAQLREEIYADALARYYRYRGENVMYAPGFDTLCYSSFMESKIESNELNDELYDTYNRELVSLDVGYSQNKVLNLRNNESLLFLQKMFLYFYNKNVIKYKKKNVLEDSERNKIYDGIETLYKEKTALHDVFTLDIERFIPHFVDNINKLPIENSYKEALIKKLDSKDLLELSFYTENDFEFKLTLEEPEILGSLQALVLNPNYIDVLDYVAPEEIFAVENFLETRNKKLLYTGNTFTNPLNGKKIPIFISTIFEEAKKPLFGYHDEDKQILLEIGIEPLNILVDGLLVNSDFLDGLELKAAHNKIIEDFVSYDMGVKITKYLKKDILISSLDKYGCPFPLMTNDLNIITLEKHLPLSFSNRFRILVPEVSKISSDYHLFSGSLNSLFLRGLLPFMSILNEKNLEIDDPLSSSNIEEVKSWLKQSVIFVNKTNIIYDLFMPILMLSIIEELEQVDFDPLYEIIISDNVYDAYGNDIKKDYNNLVKIDDLKDTYGSDAMRFYFLDSDISKPFYFDKDNIFKYRQILLNIESAYNKGFPDNDFSLEFPFYQFKNRAYDALVRLDLGAYVKNILDFLKEEDLNLTKKQALQFLIILSLITPSLAEELHYKYYSEKLMLIDYGWVL